MKITLKDRSSCLEFVISLGVEILKYAVKIGEPCSNSGQINYNFSCTNTLVKSGIQPFYLAIS